MKMMKRAVSCLVLSSILPGIAFADITFNNKTNSDLTFFYKRWCSNQVPDGVIKSGGSYVLSQDIIHTNCYKECAIDVYASTNCGGPKIVTAKVSEKTFNGVGDLRALDPNYAVEGGGSYASIKSTGLMQWFKSFLG